MPGSFAANEKILSERSFSHVRPFPALLDMCKPSLCIRSLQPSIVLSRDTFCHLEHAALNLSLYGGTDWVNGLGSLTPGNSRASTIYHLVLVSVAILHHWLFAFVGNPFHRTSLIGKPLSLGSMFWMASRLLAEACYAVWCQCITLCGRMNRFFCRPT